MSVEEECESSARTERRSSSGLRSKMRSLQTGFSNQDSRVRVIEFENKALRSELSILKEKHKDQQVLSTMLQSQCSGLRESHQNLMKRVSHLEGSYASKENGNYNDALAVTLHIPKNIQLVVEKEHDELAESSNSDVSARLVNGPGQFKKPKVGSIIATSSPLKSDVAEWIKGLAPSRTQQSRSPNSSSYGLHREKTTAEKKKDLPTEGISWLDLPINRATFPSYEMFMSQANKEASSKQEDIAINTGNFDDKENSVFQRTRSRNSSLDPQKKRSLGK